MDDRLRVGEHIGGYRITGHVFDGTYRAVDARGGRVLLEIAPRDSWRDAAIHMLRAERVAAAIQHPGIARIRERGALPDGRPWLATEFPSGLGLYDLIARRPLPGVEVTTLIRDVADVLAHVHSHGVVHRALTPRSIVLATGPRDHAISITDWGLLAETGIYAAPETRTGIVDGRADVYSLGVIAYRAVTQQFPPEHGIDDVPGVSAGLATLVARMLAQVVDERPTAAEVRALANELLDSGAEHAIDNVIADATREAAEAAQATPELISFAEDTEPNADDIVHAGGPRFGKPKWTPNPDFQITSERGPIATGEIDKKN
jgi:serine/threonine protein kinase